MSARAPPPRIVTFSEAHSFIRQRALIRPQQQIEGRKALVAGSCFGSLRCRDRGCVVGERTDIEPHVARPMEPSVTRNGPEQANSLICVRPHTASATRSRFQSGGGKG